MLQQRRNHSYFYAVVACMAGVFFSVSASAAPKSANEDTLLELPAFDNQLPAKKDEPVTLELLPDQATEKNSTPPQTPLEEKAATEASAHDATLTPPVVITPEATEAVATAETETTSTSPATIENVTYAEEFGPAQPNNTAAADTTQPSPTTETPTAETSEADSPEPSAEIAVSTEASAETPSGSSAAVKVSDEPFGPPDSRPSPETATATSTVAASFGGINDPGGDVIQDDWHEGSLMFTREEIERYKDALLTPKEVVQEQVVEQQDQAAPAPPAAPVADYGAFSLNSILYHGKGQWLIWLNKKKFMPLAESPLERVVIEKVTRKFVTFRWTPANQITLPMEAESNRLRQEKDGSLLITLSSNQTLLVDSMRILEGKALTQEVARLIIAAKERRAREKVAAEAAAAAAATQAQNNPGGIAALQALPPAAPADRDRGNMNTLIDKYRDVGLAK